jgi:acid stress chaperone HdeB
MKALSAAVLAASLMITVAPVSAQVVDISTIKCKEFVESPKDTIALIMMWLDGYYHAEDDAAVIDFDKMKTSGEKLGEYCTKNPTHGLLTAAEEILSK